MRKQIIDRWIYAFAIQLVVMHLKKNQVLMAYWILLFGFTGGWFANKFGIPYLFLDPEYMGKVGGRAFLIMGLATGAFIMAFNISGFILNSFRFPFLASLSKTFQKWVLNNFIIPSSYILFYVISVFRFQYYSQLKEPSEILINIGCFLIGVFAIVYSTWKYFLITNKDIYKLFGVEDAESEEGNSQKNPSKKRKYKNDRRQWRVDTYLTIPLRTNLVRDTSHYKPHMLQSVLKQNHINAAVVELIIFLTFIGLGIFRDHELFRIPAGASILLLFTMIIMLSGVFRYWLRAWANTAIVIVFIGLNYLSQFELINPSNKAYGLDYNSEKPAYSISETERFYTSEIFEQDKQHTLAILERWKDRCRQNGMEKPKMVLMAVSGGGLRSAYFTFSVMQAIDSATHGKLMPLTRLISGSSGGLIGAAYYRSLFLEKSGALFNPDSVEAYRKHTGMDLLNAVSFSFVVNDLFLNLQSFRDSTGRYIKDRAYAFEQQLNENTGFLLDRCMSHFKNPESEASIPMLVISPTIINDGRVFLISSTPVSYLLQPYVISENRFAAIPDGIELNHFFEKQKPGNLKLTSALRLNATFPYILPAASLPTHPPVEVMDAGIRDNYGMINAVRFLFAFRQWIELNTSGVIIIQIRDINKRTPVDFSARNTFWEKLTSPLKNATGNFILMQDYHNDQMLIHAKTWFSGNLDFVMFEMPQAEEKVSLSLHLTNKEKNFINDCVLNESNRRSLVKLTAHLQP